MPPSPASSSSCVILVPIDPACDDALRELEYSTFTQDGDDWVPNTKLKGPTVVGKPGAFTPSFVVNPKLF